MTEHIIKACQDDEITSLAVIAAKGCMSEAAQVLYGIDVASTEQVWREVQVCHC